MSSKFSGEAQILVKDDSIEEVIEDIVIGEFAEISDYVDFYIDVKEYKLDEMAKTMKDGLYHVYFWGTCVFSHTTASWMGGEEWDSDAVLDDEPKLCFIMSYDKYNMF